VDAEIRRARKGSGSRLSPRSSTGFNNDGGYEQLRMSLSQERALDLVLREATVRSA